jgi:two-component system response regulator HydG
MELDFRKSPTVLEHIVDTVVAGIFTVDATGRFVAWNLGAERITGYSARDVLGEPCSFLEGPNCKGFAALADLLHGSPEDERGMCNQECKLLSKDGREVHIHGSVQVVHESDGRVAGAVGCFMDVTCLVQANEKVAVLEKQASTGYAFEQLVGNSDAMREVFRQLKLAADSDVTVLLTGESGTGKELAARAIHTQSGRRNKPFMAINCSAIPEELLESELFGHVKGAFTGATVDRAGLFEVASQGTLFLDEIGDVSPAIQVKLLRVLQEREIRRVGDSKSRPVDVRLVTATNRDLMQLVNAEKIREDFYYRIHVFAIRLPPLRERKEDIPLLVEHFIRQICRNKQRSPAERPIDGLARDTLDVLLEYHWPGNVRELRNALEHACVLASGDRITYFDLPPAIRGVSETNGTVQGLSPEQAEEKGRIVQALRQTGGNRTKAAALLGTSRVTLWKKMTRYGIGDSC